jgi:phosphoglycolate phosphatase
MKKYRHIIWDWNGTLLDDVKLLRNIVNGLLAQYNMKILTEEERQELFGFPIIEYYKRMGFDFTKVSYKQICIGFTREYYQKVGECRLRDGAREVLGAISKKGLSQSILSVSEQKPLEKTVEEFRIRHFFTDIVGLEDHSGGTKLETGRKFIARRGMNPGEVLLIGDTVHDHEVACDLGVDCLLVESGCQSRRKLSGCGCQILNSLREIPSHI